MRIRPFNLARSLVNRLAYAQAYINRPFQTLSTTTWANSSAASSARIGPPSPTRNLAATSVGDRTRTGIIYPLQPRSKRPDVCIQVEAALPESAALLRPDHQPPTREAPTSLPRTSRRLSRKRWCNRSLAVYRPAKRSPPRGHWCDRL